MNTFSSLVAAAMDKASVVSANAAEPLAHVPYSVECAVKQAAVDEFARQLRLDPQVMLPLVPTPQPREYRTTSRRRIQHIRNRVSLTHGDGAADFDSKLEPQVHAEIFKHVEGALHAMSPMMSQLFNHVIIRGTYSEHVLIFNVAELDADVVRATRSIANRVAKVVPSLQHAWLYHDPKRSRFYLELERPATGIGAKKLMGAAAWKQTVGSVDFQVGVFSFSQVNLAASPVLVECVRKALQPTSDDMLFDLYCGYGLFSASLAKQVNGVVAIDADEVGIADARYNTRRAGGAITAVREMLRSEKDLETALRTAARMSKRIPEPEHTLVVLDPPRAGTPSGVIRTITDVLQPRRAVEVFCGPDEIARSIREWRSGGYRLTQMIPIDMFAGTMGMEFVCLFEPGVNEPPVHVPTGKPPRSGRQRY